VAEVRYGVLNIVRVIKCLQESDMREVDRSRSDAYLFHYQSSKRMGDKNNGPIPLKRSE
jgi:hypothetical protein